MKKLVENIKLYKFMIGLVASAVIFLWGVFSIYYNFNENLKVIQKSTLRNTIWNENIPLHDRLESCDSYLELGYNSETKKYCEFLLEKEEFE